MNQENVTMEALQKLTEAQALIVNVSSRLCNSCDKSAFKDNLERYKELHNVQRSIMSLTWSSIQDIEDNTRVQHSKDQSDLVEDKRTSTLKRKFISIEEPQDLVMGSKIQRITYDNARFDKHMHELDSNLNTGHV